MTKKKAGLYLVRVDGGYSLEKNGQRLVTPAGSQVCVSKVLAEALCGWENPHLWAFYSFWQDHVARDKISFVEVVVTRLEHDLIAYPDAQPEDLVDQQHCLWRPWLDWFKDHYEIDILDGTTLVARSQDRLMIDKAKTLFTSQSSLSVAALYRLSIQTGSVLLAWAFIQSKLSLDDLVKGATLVERWHLERWGHDDEAHKRLSETKNAIYRMGQIFSVCQTA